MPHKYKPQILELKEKLGISRYTKPQRMNTKRSSSELSPLRNEDTELNMTKAAAMACVITPAGVPPDPNAPAEPAYYDLTPLYSPFTDDETDAKSTFITRFFDCLLVIDGAYDVAAGIEKQFEAEDEDDRKAIEKRMMKAAIKHGYTSVDAYKSGLISDSIDKVAGRSTLLGSVIISAFKGLLYLFRVDINMIIADYLKGESSVTRRGRKLTNFEVLFKDALTRDEATGTTGNSYLVSLIQVEIGQADGLTGTSYADGEFGERFSGDMDDVR